MISAKQNGFILVQSLRDFTSSSDKLLTNDFVRDIVQDQNGRV
jgi:hypothetical protein